METTTVLAATTALDPTVVRDHGGRLVGDVALFGSATDAVEAAAALETPAGLHVGDLPRGADDAGPLAETAGRLAAMAAPGELIASDAVQLLAADALARHGTAMVAVDGPVGAWRVTLGAVVTTPAIRTIVAEDAVLVRAGLVRLLAEEGFDIVAEVGDHDELLAAARRERPDLVVTDVRMPPSQTDEGIRAAAELRAEDASVAVLVLSQHVEPAAAALLLSHNPTSVGYLLKERISHLDEFVDACRQVAAGGVVIDPLVTERLLRGRADDDAITRLTPRERDVLDLMAQGRSNAAIARELHCAAKTLEAHVRSIFTKLDMPEDPDDHRRVAAVVRWLHAEDR